MKPFALWRRIWDQVPDDPFYEPRAPLWPWLIRHQCVRAVWRPFLECSRRSRRLWRRRLAAGSPCPKTDKAAAGPAIVPAGV